ncbi:MAG: hypothetical protein NXI04_21595 [Planctomycetaceae bacterium]|nr:hypothetical protein [Planctomycetaceae bacterium]
MTGNSDLSSAAVKQWKHSVETFFRDEWSQLRQMVLELEEQGWGAEADTAGNECSPQGSADASDASPTISQRPDDRLAQLAQSIELRMQNNNCGEF